MPPPTPYPPANTAARPDTARVYGPVFSVLTRPPSTALPFLKASALFPQPNVERELCQFFLLSLIGLPVLLNSFDIGACGHPRQSAWPRRSKRDVRPGPGSNPPVLFTKPPPSSPRRRPDVPAGPESLFARNKPAWQARPPRTSGTICPPKGEDACTLSNPATLQTTCLTPTTS